MTANTLHLHIDRADGSLQRLIGQGDILEGHRHYRRIVHIGVEAVLKLKGPAPRFALGIFDDPVTVVENLLIQQPFARPHQAGVVGGEA